MMVSTMAVKDLVGSMIIHPNSTYGLPHSLHALYPTSSYHHRGHASSLDAVKRESSSGAEDKKDQMDDALKPQIMAYNKASLYPPKVISTATYVDVEQKVLFLPINGRPVPFHISTIKSVSKQDKEEATYLRVKFYTPGQALGKEAPPSMVSAVARWPLKVFIEEVIIRAVKGCNNIQQQFRLVTKLLEVCLSVYYERW